MRILADIADVKELKKAFKNNEDIHSLTASQVFNISLNKIDKETRRKAKAINFGIIYGISQYGLAKQISVSNSEAADFLKSYFKKFPEIKDYMNSTINFCRKSGYVNNIFGRRCYITGINDKNYNVRNFQERAAINAPIQGSAADIMRLAMIKITREFEKKSNYKTKMLLQIHDELVFETPQDELEKIIPIIKKNMSDASSSEHHKFNIPLTVDINYGNNWDEAN
jgi:DNA polymerase-1